MLPGSREGCCISVYKLLPTTFFACYISVYKLHFLLSSRVTLACISYYRLLSPRVTLACISHCRVPAARCLLLLNHMRIKCIRWVSGTDFFNSKNSCFIANVLRVIDFANNKPVRRYDEGIGLRRKCDSHITYFATSPRPNPYPNQYNINTQTHTLIRTLTHTHIKFCGNIVRLPIMHNLSESIAETPI